MFDVWSFSFNDVCGSFEGCYYDGLLDLCSCFALFRSVLFFSFALKWNTRVVVSEVDTVGCRFGNWLTHMLLYVIHGSGLVWNDNAGFGVCSQINEAVKVGDWLCEERRLNGMPNDHVRSEGCLCACSISTSSQRDLWSASRSFWTRSHLNLECMTGKESTIMCKWVKRTTVGFSCFLQLENILFYLIFIFILN